MFLELMKKILLFGAGKSATVLIDYLLQHSLAENWLVLVADIDVAAAKKKIGNALGGEAIALDITADADRSKQIAGADLVISLLPPSLHILVAQDCLQHKKNLLTASYVDDNLKALQPQIEAAGLLFLCEMGLDPGIDHMSAKKLIDEIHAGGGTITSFLSHCGGLVAPQSDDNPWHYKISWNPKNLVQAGKSGAGFKQSGTLVQLPYEQLFSEKRFVSIPGEEPLCWYPNRDSVPYAAIYNLQDCPTFIRTTLRHPDFIYGWKNIIDLRLTDETLTYDTTGKSLSDFFQEHLQKAGFEDWLQKKMRDHFALSKKLLEDLVSLVELEEKREESGDEKIEEFMIVTDKGDLEEFDIDALKTNAAATVADKMHEAKLTLQQLFFLGMDDKETCLNKGEFTAAEVLQLALEKKLALLPADKDRVVMVHEIEWMKGGEKHKHTSSLILDGENDQHTAMAKTVGLPLGIAAKFILNGTIELKGLQIPIHQQIYKPVLKELENYGIVFMEQQSRL